MTALTDTVTAELSAGTGHHLEDDLLHDLVQRRTHREIQQKTQADDEWAASYARVLNACALGPVRDHGRPVTVEEIALLITDVAVGARRASRGGTTPWPPRHYDRARPLSPGRDESGRAQEVPA